MALVDKTKKVSGNIDLTTNKELGEEKGQAPEVHQAVEESQPAEAVAQFVTKDGKLLEQAGTEEAQDSGIYEKAAKKAGVKKEDLQYTAATQAAAQAYVSEKKETDALPLALGEKAELLGKSAEFPKSITAMHLDGDLHDPHSCTAQIKLHMKHAGQSNSIESRIWHHRQAKDIYDHMTGSRPYEPVRYDISKSMKLCKSLKVNPELLSDKPTHIHEGVKVKVYSKTSGKDSEGKKVHTAEIMEGEHKGKWTTVHAHKLKPLDGSNVHKLVKSSKELWGKKMAKCSPELYKSVDIKELRARAHRAHVARRVNLLQGKDAGDKNGQGS